MLFGLSLRLSSFRKRPSFASSRGRTRRMCWFYMRLAQDADANYYAYPLDLVAQISDDLRVSSVHHLPTSEHDRLRSRARPFDRRRLHQPAHSEYHPNLRPSPARTLLPYRVLQPEGSSVRVGPGGLLTWDSWRLRVGFNYREGMTLHDVRFRGRSLFYRLSLAELFVPYADPRPVFQRKAALDLGNDGAGVNANRLRPGCDCLGVVSYLDGWLVTAEGEPLHMANVICCHEQDDGLLWKHTSFRTGNAVAARSRVLVLQTVMTVSNYDYMLAFILGQDASIRYEVRATGILSTVANSLDSPSPSYGTVVAPGVLAPSHQHLFCLRVDPALDGHDNSLLVEESRPLEPSDPHGVGFAPRSRVVEREAGFDLDPASNRVFKLVNEGVRNPVSDTPVGFRLDPWPSQMLLAQPNSFHAKRAEFARHAIWLTRYADDELFPAGRYTMQSLGREGIASAIESRSQAADASTTRNADIVLWHTFGCTHNPRVEDWPVMPCETMVVGLKPVNFFSRNPARQFPGLINGTIDEINKQLDLRCISSVDLVTTYTERIAQVNKIFRAVTEVNPEAISQARLLDENRGATGHRSPLYGLPILLKNVIATNDKMNNTAGSYAMLGARNVREAGVVKKLRAVGAVLLGKSNLSQWGGIRALKHTNGWSAHGGQVRGAYIQDQDPGGSSSGSAVAVDLGLAFAALGVDTTGSILIPAGRNNIVAIRPTLGLTSRDQVVPVSENFDVVGPMARTVRDASHVLQAIAGPDQHDGLTLKAPLPVPDFVAACNGASLRGKRIGVPWNFINALITGPPLNDELLAFNKTLKELGAAGASIITADFTEVAELKTWRNVVLGVDFPANMDTYLGGLTANPQEVRSLLSLRDWTQAHGQLEDYPNRDTGFWDVFLEKRAEGWSQSPHCKDYQDAVVKMKKLGGDGGILGAIERQQLDAVVMPTSITYRCVPFTGGPAITVPLGAYPDSAGVVRTSNGGLIEVGPKLPFGLTFAGKPWSETELIGMASAYEKLSNVRNKLRRSPAIPVPSAELLAKFKIVIAQFVSAVVGSTLFITQGES
ncbi:hypothetical protein CDD80_5312 [Ophiocordyceps camponoti-rufipedis]|uniref:Amine oxidase n=1 Tax=Ophiocordyceps camponoti-rufipedis TaxID=2004952 RepID=A0A2C5YUF3_9HYPO|nr:hypothetical protein CDD80_5312 [Ophiocordyceps camponoti-rufipedis]